MFDNHVYILFAAYFLSRSQASKSVVSPIAFKENHPQEPAQKKRGFSRDPRFQGYKPN